MAHNIFASLDELACNDYLDFVKNQEIFGRVFCSRNESRLRHAKLETFKKGDNGQFGLLQSFPWERQLWNS